MSEKNRKYGIAALYRACSDNGREWNDLHRFGGDLRQVILYLIRRLRRAEAKARKLKP